MRITDMTNLFVGNNKAENFKILICALDEEEAVSIAETYRNESGMSGAFEVSEFTDVNEKFDCVYVLTYSEEC